LRPGKWADLLVVAGDPATDITAIGETILVFKAGVPYDPAALRESVVGAIGAH
jgi:imidazolonepropionase-like amidohydrolase